MIRGFNHRRGAAVVEFAVVLPLLCFFLFGILEVGYAFLVRHTIAVAARDGARVASIPGATEADAIEAVDQTMSGLGINGYTVTSNLASLGTTGPIVWVEVSINVDRVTFSGHLFGGGNVPLTSRVYMHREGL